MKAIKFFAMMVAMLAMCVNFSSCKDDDDPVEEIEKEETGIVGTWMESGSNWSATFVFSKDGTGSMTEVETTSQGHSQKTTLLFTYVYTENDNRLKLYIDGSNTVENYTCRITGNTMMLDQGNTTYILKRQ